ncbi:hypothetical protein HDU86_007982 [Geranomyces michiganensis]|nr:hypothetical protein HDU86_007982 [Geranomyces michiganensis]
MSSASVDHVGPKLNNTTHSTTDVRTINDSDRNGVNVEAADPRRSARSYVPKFTAQETRNIIFYIIGIMAYKFALESFNGTIKALALERLAKSEKFTWTGYLDGFNQAAQCIGSILIAPLVKRFPTRTVLAAAVAVFSVVASLGMIIEVATGGKSPQQSSTGKAIPGDWNPRIIVGIFSLAGISHGMVELIRRVIPADIVGGNVQKLKRMDATVHIMYEVAGTGGAFFATYMALRMGKAFAPIATPIGFFLAALFWSRIHVVPVTESSLAALEAKEQRRHGNVFLNVLRDIGASFASFGVSILEGAKIIFGNRKFSWLILGYSLPLVLHRYLENGLASNFSSLVLKESAYGSILVGGSNFGELCGAAFVFLFTNAIRTPLPWLRLDAVTLSIGWVFYKRTPESFNASPLATAWIMAAILVPVSFGWAAGDVSLSAFVQSHVSRLKRKSSVSPLGSVMAFLYCTYIVIYAIANPVIGRWLDNMVKEETALAGGDAKIGELKAAEPYFKIIGGIVFSVLGVVIFAATFMPKGSRSFNPSLEEDYPENHEDEDEYDPNYKSKAMETIG